MANETLVEERPDRAELLILRHLGVDPVQLPQVDAVDLEPAQAHVNTLAYIVRIADRRPRAGIVRVSDEPPFVAIVRPW